MANLPTVSSPLPRDLQQFIQRVREALDSGGLDGAVTARQLVAAGIASFGTGVVTNPTGTVVEAPRAPTGLAASGALANIILTWNSASYSGHAYTEIWAAAQTSAQAAASENPVLGQAELVGMNAGNNFAHQLGAAATRWYWVRNINVNGAASAYNATDGLQAATGTDPAYMLALLTDAVTSSQLASTLLANINTTFSQTSEPTQKADGSALVAGDTWVNTTQGQNRMYRYNGSNWIDVQDNGIAQAISAASGAQGTADGKVTTYYQTGAPSNSQGTLGEGDLWVDTDDGNNLYRWNNTSSAWVDIQDDGIGQAIQDAADAQSTADGKITSYYQDNAPTNANGELSEGDLWTDTNDNDSTYRWDADGGDNSGGAWVRVGLASFADVTSSITDQVGYCELSIVSGGNTTKSVSAANTTQTLCQAAQAAASKPSSHTYAWKSDGAIASEIKTVTSSVDTNTATIQVQSNSIDGLDAQYTVKIDNNGHVSGFGLASNALNSPTIQSKFLVAANRFAIVDATKPWWTVLGIKFTGGVGSPQAAIEISEANYNAYTYTSSDKILMEGHQQTSSNAEFDVVGKGYNQYLGYHILATRTGTNAGNYRPTTPESAVLASGACRVLLTSAVTVPFAVQASASTLNGETVPAGTYIADAFIKNGSITNAKIGTLTADKITASLLNTVDFYGNTIAGSTIYVGGSVTYNQDSGGNNIGISSVSSPKVAMTSTGAVFAVDAFKIDNPGGTDVVPFSITNDVVSINSALIETGAITNAKIADVIQSTTYTAGSAGWKINKGGEIELNNATFRGNINVTSNANSNLSRVEITNSTIKVFEGSNLRVKIGNLA